MTEPPASCQYPASDIESPISWEPSLSFLKYAIASQLIGSLAVLVALRVLAPDQNLRTLASVLVFLTALVGWHLLRRRRIFATIYVLAYGVWTVVTVIAAFTGGVRAPAVIVYPVIILMVGWMISSKAALFATGLSLTATSGFLLAESWGYLPVPLPSPPALYGVVQVVLAVLSLILIGRFVSSYQNRIEELRRISNELTDRTQVMEATQKDLNRAQAVGNTGSWVYDIANDSMRLSAETCRIFGLPVGTTGSHAAYLARTPVQDRSAIDDAWKKALKGAAFDQEHRIVVRKEIRWIRQKAEIEFSEDGRPLSAVGITQDITERRRVEAEIIATKNQLQTVLDAIPDLLFEVGLDSRIYTYHSRREDLLVAPPNVFLGKLMSEVVPPDVAGVCLSALAEAADKGASSGKVYALQLPQGERWFELSVAAMPEVAEQERRFIVLSRDITERKKAEDEVKNLAFYDPLTRLPNRRLLRDRLKQALASSTRSGRYGALLFIDLDNFKILNDTLGHDTGDLLLVQAAQRLTDCVRENDTVARLGGDEFVVMIDGLSMDETDAATRIQTVSEKILAALNQPYQLASYTHNSTASIGVTLFANHQEAIDELLKRADLAMYQAKAAGRNTLKFFDPEMQSAITNRAALDADLHEAITSHQFLLYYQPQVVGQGRLTGAEALVRWKHPQRGLVPPVDFIPLAEDTGLILPLGHWVMETACSQLAAWAARPEMAHLTIAVNVSARQFHQRDFVDQVLALLDRSGANPQRLKLELTESMLVDNVEDIVAKMGSLKARGVCFSLDDFGTGYSSLSYLKRLPLDQLKIDQGFVRNILTDANDAAISKMVVALAESMGLAVIAEGVEIEAQRDFLEGQGCLAYQGYLFGRPLPLEGFEQLVSSETESLIRPVWQTLI
jgi:diguanylate cyclase (GGDEF)-like protein